MRTTTALVLRCEGYTVSEAATGQEALDFLTYNSVDVLLTDLVMEPMDGLTLLKKALEAAPRLQVIIMTAFGSIDTSVEAVRLGACDDLTKPFKADVLLQRGREAAAISAPPRGSGEGERGAPGSFEAGNEEGADSASGLGRAATKDLRVGCVRLRQVWRQA